MVGVPELKDLLCDEFQDAVRESLVRHTSILDILSKYQEASARISRAISKAVTTCGCIQIEASKPDLPSDITLQELRNYMTTHLKGNLCEHCVEVVEEEIGRQLFYLAALCNALDLNIYDVLIKEHKKLSTLGIFNIS